jgi:hypothetical protein
MDHNARDEIAEAEAETAQGAAAAFQVAATGYLLARQGQQDQKRSPERSSEPEPEAGRSLWQRVRDAVRVLRGADLTPAAPERSGAPEPAPVPDADAVFAAGHAADRALWAAGVDAAAVPGMSDVELRSAWDAAQKWTSLDPDANAAARHVAQTALEYGRDIGIDTETLTQHADGQVQVNAEAAAELAGLTRRAPQLDADPTLKAASEQLNATWQATATAPARIRQILADYAPEQIGAIERSTAWQNGTLINGLREMERAGTDVKAWLNEKTPDLAGVRYPGAYLNKIVATANTPNAQADGKAATGVQTGPTGAARPVQQKVADAKAAKAAKAQPATGKKAAAKTAEAVPAPQR